MNRKPHYIKIGAGNRLNPDKPYPLLDTISPCFVKRLIMFDIPENFILRQRGKKNLRGSRKRMLIPATGQTYTCINPMTFSRQRPKHTNGIRFTCRFPKNLIIIAHNGICGNDQIVGFHRFPERFGLFGCNIKSHIRTLKLFRVGFINILKGSHAIFQPQTIHQLISPGRIGSKYQVIT